MALELHCESDQSDVEELRIHSFAGCHAQNFEMIFGFIGLCWILDRLSRCDVAWSCMLAKFQTSKIDGELSEWCQNCTNCLLFAKSSIVARLEQEVSPTLSEMSCCWPVLLLCS